MPDLSPSASTEAKISRGMVRIYKDYLGRGPTSATTTIADNFVTTICRESLTKAEISLVSSNDEETVRSIRRKFQTAMGGDICALVEGLVDRKSVGFLSDHDVSSDISVEIVVLEDEASASE